MGDASRDGGGDQLGAIVSRGKLWGGRKGIQGKNQDKNGDPAERKALDIGIFIRLLDCQKITPHYTQRSYLNPRSYGLDASMRGNLERSTSY